MLGGCKKEEMDCFNKLGLASHLNTVRNMQKKVCFAFDKAATNWKDEIVTREKKILLLEEVQTTSQTDDGMEVSTIDFSREAVSCCERH